MENLKIIAIAHNTILSQIPERRRMDGNCAKCSVRIEHTKACTPACKGCQKLTEEEEEEE
ncbi:uncharacterized protein LOC122575499 isoform X2 [Bombus pyrosoma]|uniref:uncharacterized protein LOC122575499 isoform X2 n=1 Tax=Bombus pyrosoma TaxID=396416 RepID=UPI001CB8FBFE|nr:uncharacterized protein LOC122575499 isoform X2 [Bombus pyrosoma]